MVYWKHRPAVRNTEEPPDTIIDLRRVRDITIDDLVMALTFSTRTYNIKYATVQHYNTKIDLSKRCLSFCSCD